MPKAKVVLTDRAWDSLDIEHRILDTHARLVPLTAKGPADFFPEAADCDALLNNYAGPITAETMAMMPNCKIIARYGVGVDTVLISAES